MKTAVKPNWNICRICLQSALDMINIFTEENSKKYIDMFSKCGGIDISEDDNLPEYICKKCDKVLRLSFRLSHTIKQSHKHLNYAVKSSNSFEGIENEEHLMTSDEEENLNDELNEIVNVKEEIMDNYEYTNNQDDLNDLIVEDVDQYEVYSGEENNDQYSEYLLADCVVEELNEEVQDAEGVAMNTVEYYLDESIVDEVVEPTPEKKPEPKRRGRKPRDKNVVFVCETCGNTYATKARLTEHKKFHNGIKPHECEICGHRFVQNQQLVRHMNTHTGQRPYKCNFCSAAFADRSTKTKHHRIHTMKRPYQCDTCEKTFTYSDNLKFHKMIHTGEKPHKCDLCGKGFTKAYKMRVHRSTHEKHGVQIYTPPKAELLYVDEKELADNI